MESEKEEITSKKEMENKKENEESSPKKRSKVFVIIMIVMLLQGGWYGITKYLESQRHEENDDAQIEADIIPIITSV